MNITTQKLTRERTGSLVRSDYMSTNVSPISPVTFDHALQQLESDLGLQTTISRDELESFPAVQEGQQGLYGPVVNSPKLSKPAWHSHEEPVQRPVQRPNVTGHSVGIADVPALALSNRRPALNSTRLSIDGSNIELVSDHVKSFAGRPASTTPTACSPILAAGNMNGIKRSKRANFHRPAPRRLQQRRNSLQSLSSIDDASPTTPDLQLKFTEPLRTSPQQLPRLVIPSIRKKSSAADERGYEIPPPVPPYSMNRPRRTPVSAGHDMVSVSPRTPSAEWGPVENSPKMTPIQPAMGLSQADSSIDAVLRLQIPDVAFSTIPPQPHTLQAIKEIDLAEDSPTLPRTQSLPEPTKTPISPPTNRDTILTFPSDLILEPYIIEPSPAEDRFFTISDYYTEDSPYDRPDQYYSLQKIRSARSKSMPNTYTGFTNHGNQSFLHDDDSSSSSSSSDCEEDVDDVSMGLRDYVQRILRRSSSQRKSTTSWKERIGSSFLLSESNSTGVNTVVNSNRNSADTSSIAGSSSDESSSRSSHRHSSSGSSISSASSVSGLHDDSDCTDISITVSDIDTTKHDTKQDSSVHAEVVGEPEPEPEVLTITTTTASPTISINTTAAAVDAPISPISIVSISSITSSSAKDDNADQDTDALCRICGDLFPIRRYHSKPTLECKHDAEACRPCLSRWVKAKIAARNGIDVLASSPSAAGAGAAPAPMSPLSPSGDIKCPAFGCGLVLSEEDVVAVAEMKTRP